MRQLIEWELDRFARIKAKATAQPENLGYAALYTRIAHYLEDSICQLAPCYRDKYWHIFNAIEGV